MSAVQKQWAALWREVDRLIEHLSDEDGGSRSESRFNVDQLPGTGSDKGAEQEEFPAEHYLYNRVIAGMASKVSEYAEERHLVKLAEYWSELTLHLDYMPGAVPTQLRERLDLLLDKLLSVDRTKIYEARPEPAIDDLPRLIVGVNDQLALRAAKEPEVLWRLSPRGFEELVAEIFDGFGYQVELVAGTGDGGKDLVAVRSDHGILEKLIVECKRYRPSSKVGVGLVRGLWAVKNLEKATKALLVTTSYFTRGAREFERQHLYELQLADFDALTQWLREYSEAMARYGHDRRE